MADKQKMEITILPNGEVSIKVLCVPGPSCESVSAALEVSATRVRTVTGDGAEPGAREGSAPRP